MATFPEESNCAMAVDLSIVKREKEEHSTSVAQAKDDYKQLSSFRERSNEKKETYLTEQEGCKKWIVRNGEVVPQGSELISLTNKKTDSHRRHQCTMCNKSYKSSNSLQRHITFQHIPEMEVNYSCDECGKKFLTENSMLKHKVKHKSKKKLFRCSICDKGFTHLFAKTSHERTHGKPIYECEICHKVFPKPSAFEKHMRIHTGEKPFKCDICFKGFPQKGYLVAHLRTHTGEKPYKCSICNMEFAHSQSKNRHMKTHAARETFKCDECQKPFLSKFSLSVHKQIHAGQKHICKICSKAFSSISYLKSHMTKHSADREKKFRCNICEMRFFGGAALKAHESRHFGEKSFKCAVCGKGFFTKSNHDDHQRVHFKSKTLQCSLCSKKFSNNYTFRCHMIDIHKSSMPFKCKLCPKTFLSKSGLRGHINRFHNKMNVHRIFQCSLCNKVLTTSESLEHHIKEQVCLKVYKCGVCGLKVRTSASLASHKRVHRKNRLKCRICARTFSQPACLRNHMLIHMDSKPYSCDQCEKRFRRKFVLNMHKQVHMPKEDCPEECEKCGKRFMTQHHLKKHLQTHSMLMRKCPHCDKIFNSNALSHHLRIHSGIRFKCSVCGVTLSRKTYLRTHLVKLHGLEKNHALNQMLDESAVGENRMYSISKVTDINSLTDADISEESHKVNETGPADCTCPVCKKVFSCYKNTKRHVRRQHQEGAQDILDKFQASLEVCVNVTKTLSVDTETADFIKMVKQEPVESASEAAAELSTAGYSVSSESWPHLKNEGTS